MINHSAILVGEPEVGKSSLARQIVKEHLELGALVLVMDCHRQFASMIPWFPEISHFMQEQQKRQTAGAAVLRCAAIGSSDSEALTGFAMDLAKRYDTGDGVPLKGSPAFISIVYDESFLIEGFDAHYVPPLMKELYTQRRHIGIGVAITTLAQDMGMLAPLVQLTASELNLFRTESEERIRKAESRFGLAKGTLASAMVSVPKQHAYLKIVKGSISAP